MYRIIHFLSSAPIFHTDPLPSLLTIFFTTLVSARTTDYLRLSNKSICLEGCNKLDLASSCILDMPHCHMKCVGCVQFFAIEHTHTHTHTHTYTHIHTHIHTHTCTHTLIHTHTYIHTHVHTHIHVHTHTHTHTNTYTHVHTHNSYLTVIEVHGQMYPNYC